MTENEQPTQEHEETGSTARKFILPALVIIVAIMLVAFLASRSGLDRALLRQQLDAFATELADNARKEGRDVRFTYEDVVITGSFSDRHAEVVAPQLVVKPIMQPGQKAELADELTIRTARVAIFPKAVDLSQLRVEMPDPFEFYAADAPEKKLLTVSANEPFAAMVGRVKKADRLYTEIEHVMPTEITFNYLREQQAEGEEEQTPTLVPVYETMTLTQATGGTASSSFAQDGSGLGKASVQLNDITITPEKDPEASIDVAEIRSRWSHTLNANNHHVITGSLHIGDVTAAPEVIPYAPIALHVEASYQGAAPQTAEDIAAVGGPESSFKLKEFALTTKEAGIQATADFVAGADDVLPVGMATLNLTNVPFVLGELRRYQLLKTDDEALVDDFAGLIAGKPISELENATIEISRTRGGSFTIGNATFEELFATLLKNSMQRRAPAAPEAEEAPASAPVAPAPNPAAAEPQEGHRG